ncbi:MAG: hypothetical protein ABI574_14265, partial [Burkholderiales bacterium]
QSLDHPRIAPPLGHRIDGQADAAQIAAATTAIWQEIDAALTPILGRRGVAALYQRSLSLGTARHPWLTGQPVGSAATLDLGALKLDLAQQTSADAAAGSSTLLLTFHGLLTSLVGASLTERLLRSVWTPSSSGPAAQDTSP